MSSEESIESKIKREAELAAIELELERRMPGFTGPVKRKVSPICPNCGRSLFRNGEPEYITNSLHLQGRCPTALREESYQSDTKSRMETRKNLA